MKKSIFIFRLVYLVIIILIGFIFSSSVFGGYSGKYKTISQNETKLISLPSKSKINELYRNGELRFLVISDKVVEIEERESSIFLSVPLGVYTGTGTLEVLYKSKRYTIPLQINIDPKDTDFNIYSNLKRNKLQEHTLSCESAATASILSYLLQESIEESAVISLLPKSDYYNKISETKNKIRYWGDPQNGFVGLIDNSSKVLAKQKLYTGYGVYELPIIQVYTEYGFSTERINVENHSPTFTASKHLSYLLGRLQKGDMIQLWGDWCTRADFDDGQISVSEISQKQIDIGVSGKNECYNTLEDRTLQWYFTDSDGNQVSHTGLDGEHAFVLLGWKGEKNNPSHIRVWDTNTGYHQYQTSEWMRKWKLMSYRSVVVHAK